MRRRSNSSYRSSELRKMARTYLRQRAGHPSHHLRRQQAVKRGGGYHAATLSGAGRRQREDFDLVRLDEALDELAVARPRHSRIVELRFFGGLTIEETAGVLGVSHATVEREWRLARARQVSQEKARRPTT